MAIAKKKYLNIDDLIEIVAKGGVVKTGVDIHNDKGVLLLQKDVRVSSPKPLLYIKKLGLNYIEIDPSSTGGLWDKNGKPIAGGVDEKKPEPPQITRLSQPDVINKIKGITQLKKDAVKKFQKAKENIKQVISDIKKTGGEFDYGSIEVTVSDLLDFLSTNENGFSYLTKEIFFYDDYLYNHSINVCTIGTAILSKFNVLLGDQVAVYRDNELLEISIGYFMHDVGKVLIPDEILNKQGKLTDKEFEIVKTHSFEKGLRILEKNKLTSPFILQNVIYHHGEIFKKEARCYPADISAEKIPPYVKICKLSDIYDAMTSKRCYKEAFNPVNVVTELVRKYADKDRILQYILQSFVKSIGVYPPGSVVYLTNNQMAYILDSTGPLVIPFTDKEGNTFNKGQFDPISLSDEAQKEKNLRVDANKPLKSPLETYDLLPDWLRKLVITTK